MKTSQIIAWGAGCFALVFLVAYLFNHVSPWAAIGLVLVAAYLLARKYGE